jgi:hypothetical protein
MKRNSILIAFTLALLLAGSVFAAPSTHKGKLPGDLRISGTVVSTSSSELVLTSKIKGKTEQEAFAVNPETKTMGSLTAGERVIVHYKNQNGQKIATRINAHKMMAAKGK